MYIFMIYIYHICSLFLADEENWPDTAPDESDDFFPTNPDLANMLDDTALDFDMFVFCFVEIQMHEQVCNKVPYKVHDNISNTVPAVAGSAGAARQTLRS